MTRAELQRIRDRALAQAAKAQPKTPEDTAGLMRVRAFYALASAADTLDAMLARDGEANVDDEFAALDDLTDDNPVDPLGKSED